MALSSFSARTAAGTIISFATNLFGGVHYSLKGLINTGGVIIDPATHQMQSAGNSSLATIAALSKAEDTVANSGDPGIMAFAVRKDAAGPFGGDGDYSPLQVDAAGNLRVAPTSSPAATAALSNVASAATSTAIIAANASRRGLLIVNDDANALKIKYGTTASATSYSVNIPGNGAYWEMPPPIYTGAIDGIWDADGAGSARVTEL